MSRRDELAVWKGERRVGTLWRGNDGRSIGFEYDADWQASGVAISTSLPLARAVWPPEDSRAHRWFGNLLPEEQAREALIKRLGVPDDDFSLLAAIGGDCAGALVILPSDQSPQRGGTYQPLPLDKLGHWAAFRERYALMAGDAPEARPRLSLAGAQDKIPVHWRDGTLYLPMGNAPSTHILKFAVEGREQVVFNELYLNTLAREAGLACPVTTMHVAGRHPYLMVERYDRTGLGTTHIERIHQEDLCQAMGLSRSQKYQSFNGPRFGQCVQAVREACRPPAASIQQLLTWQIFNVLVGNSDAHAKNVSLLQDDRGRWQIAPAYDLVGTIVLGYHADLAFSVGDQFNSMQLLPRDWQQFASECGFSYPFVKRQIAELAAKLLALGDSERLRDALLRAGLPENGWLRLQQQRQHIQRQCRRAQRW
ncbi:type II toxin-antitoxin system HipA family toxin [Halomonas sp. McH1-25]|uniref:type II toxin-antitoxin system HipA family toxin n=1 Tax=unclassified Halomonas TaxID=2609666 RepID=UPI001EF677DC|nr:type II toxin-antitoxin system HipA family toxin [Halomonas sp. McH1-25]MCP1340916.1 type II toxin-antitoxin system HipA family toxin [Halomonas sp. FL8]MCP1362310.1 type II toxin-antitoxin system HipA family toxin [Halomonas sp. BBD45]